MVAAVPAADRAACERQIGMRHDALRIEIFHRAQAVAARAGAHRVVEREQARLELGQRVVAHRARVLGGKQMFLAAVRFHYDGLAVGVAQGGFQGLGETLAGVRPRAQPVDDYVDRVLDVLRHARDGVELVHFSVDAHAREALRAQLLEQIRLLAFAARDHRREDHEAAILRQRGELVDHLGDGLRFERELVLGAVRRAGARVQQAQVVVDLCDGAHGRARIVAGRFLLDRDRRRQALDQVDVGLGHQLEELACVGGERFHVAALALRVERVERERALAGARQPGDHDEPVARQLEAEVLQVVRARAANPN